ncbi:MurR/RpiR family transcriptional regulator [Pediococcus siamensis]|uniref:MurR/RpiR family transcriptional regulator n=1 Tax=Pediococcus siamensis TaxID=381829 RepID=UPI0039A1C50A
MFPYERVKLLNQLELSIYKHIIAHPVEVETMTIRQLAKKSHVSPTTILRFLHKMDFDGYSEFKYALKRQQKIEIEQPTQQSMVPTSQFFDQVNDASFLDKINQAAKLITAADTSLLFGLGTSGSLAQYGARLLANYGIYTLTFTDPFQPKPLARRDFSDTLLVLLSVSGGNATGAATN